VLTTITGDKEKKGKCKSDTDSEFLHVYFFTK
jgi:hypothetical protein